MYVFHREFNNILLFLNWGIHIMTNLPFALQGSAANICVLAFIFITLYRMGIMLKKNSE